MGALEASTNYIKSPYLGMALGVGAASLGFWAGSRWDRTAALRREGQQWREYFGQSPGPGAHGKGYDNTLASQLAPWNETVPFESARHSQVRKIRTWCLTDKPGLVWLLSGGPGTGKTRLAMRVAETVRRHADAGWVCGWLREAGSEAIEFASSGRQPALIIVDNADTRQDLAEVVGAVHRQHRRQNVKLLLIARDFGKWWTKTQGPMTFAVDLAGTTSLGPLAESQAGQVVAARRAVAAFAPDGGVVAIDVHFVGVTRHTPVFKLHAAAFMAARHIEPSIEMHVDVEGAIDWILAEEEDVWEEHASRLGLAHRHLATRTVLRNVLVLTAVIGGQTRDESRRIIRHVPSLQRAEDELVDLLSIWLHLYDRTVGFWAHPQIPGVLLEHLVVKALLADPGMATAFSSLADTRQDRISIIRVLVRASTHIQDGPTALDTLLRYCPSDWVECAVQVALETQSPIDQVLAEAVDAADFDWETAARLLGSLQGEPLFLAHTWVAIQRTLSRRARRPVDRIKALCELSVALSRIGALQRAVEASAVAVSDARVCILKNPEERRFLAYALSTHADALIQLGYYSQAVDAASEAAVLQSIIAESGAKDVRPYAQSLTTLANAHHRAGDHDRTLEAAVRARDLLLTMHDKESGAMAAYYAVPLADALTFITIAQHELLLLVDAVSTSETEVIIRRQIVTMHIEGQHHFLAACLERHATALLSVDRVDEAISFCEEAIRIWRAILSSDGRLFYMRLMGQTFLQYYDALAKAERPADARRALVTAAEILGALPDVEIVTIANRYFYGLVELVECSLRLDLVEEAAEASNHLIAEAGRLAGLTQHISSRLIANALGIRAAAQQRVGRRMEALEAAFAASEIYRELLLHEVSAEDAHNLRLAEKIIGECGPQ